MYRFREECERKEDIEASQNDPFGTVTTRNLDSLNYAQIVDSEYHLCQGLNDLISCLNFKYHYNELGMLISRLTWA